MTAPSWSTACMRRSCRRPRVCRRLAPGDGARACPPATWWAKVDWPTQAVQAGPAGAEFSAIPQSVTGRSTTCDVRTPVRQRKKERPTIWPTRGRIVEPNSSQPLRFGIARLDNAEHSIRSGGPCKPLACRRAHRLRNSDVPTVRSRSDRDGAVRLACTGRQPR